MNEHDFRTNGNERGQTMPNAEPNAYRRAFWIALVATAVLAVVASVLWWRLNHGAAVQQSGTASTSDPMQGMAQTSSANATDSEPGALGETQTGNMQETPLAPIQLTPQRMQSIGIVLGKVESKSINSELRFYGRNREAGPGWQADYRSHDLFSGLGLHHRQESAPQHVCAARNHAVHGSRSLRCLGACTGIPKRCGKDQARRCRRSHG